jgi:hypothetical protein
VPAVDQLGRDAGERLRESVVLDCIVPPASTSTRHEIGPIEDAGANDDTPS